MAIKDKRKPLGDILGDSGTRPSLDSIMTGQYIPKQETPKEYSNLLPDVGQFTGNIAGGIASGGNPIGMAAGGMGGRIAGRLSQIQNDAMIKDANASNSVMGKIGAVSMNNPITMPVMLPKYLNDLSQGDKKKLGNEMAITAATEALSIPIGWGAGKVIGKLANSLKNTNETIRAGLRTYLTDINKEFGKRLAPIWEKVGGKNIALDSVNLQNTFKQSLQEGGIINEAGEYIGKLSQDKRLFNAFTSLNKDISKSVNIDGNYVSNLMKGLNSITRETVKVGNKTINPTERIIGSINRDVLKTLDEQGVKGISEINKWYAPKRQLFEEGEKLFKPFSNEITAGKRGLSTLSNYNKEPYTKDLLDKMVNDIGLKNKEQVLRSISRNSYMKEVGRLPIPFMGNLGQIAEGSKGLMGMAKPIVPPLAALAKTAFVDFSNQE